MPDSRDRSLIARKLGRCQEHSRMRARVKEFRHAMVKPFDRSDRLGLRELLSH
jgi:hypothetical protein